MKVLHIASGDLWAGAEVQIYTLLTHLGSQMDTYAILFNEGELASRLKSTNVKVIVLPESDLSGLQLFKKVLLTITRIQPDIIHTHRQKENILGAAACIYSRLRYRQKIISFRTIHGSSEYQPKGLQHIYSWLDWFVGNYIQKKIIVVSSDLALKLKSRFHPSQIVTIHNGIDRNRLNNITPATDIFDNNQFQVGIVGRIETVKRIDIFLETAKELLNTLNSHVRFHVIGEGKLRKQMESYAQTLGIQQSVIFHGHRSDIHNCIKALDCLVMCSDHEGTPMTILEALTLSIPIVVHGVGGLLEILPEKSNSLVYEHTPKAYTRAVANQLLHQVPCPELSEKYDATVNAQKITDLYNTFYRHK